MALFMVIKDLDPTGTLPVLKSAKGANPQPCPLGMRGLYVKFIAQET